MCCVAQANFARSNDGAIERGAAIEFTDDARQHRWILRLRIGIKSGHHAAIAQFFRVNAYVADGNDSSRPVALFQVWDVGKKNVGAQATMVNIQVARGAVGCDEQWQNIKGLRRRDLLQSHRFASRFEHQLQRLRRVPEMAINYRYAIRVDGALQAEHLWPRPRG